VSRAGAGLAGKSPFWGDNFKAMLHITNGDSVIHSFKEVRIPGEYLSWMDVLHDGPVPGGLTLDELAPVRARFIADAGWSPYEAALAGFKERNRRLGEFSRHDEVVLWFEHDLFDQLQLIEILNWFASRNPGQPPLTMINIGSHPEKPDFEGLGELTGSQLAALLPSRKPVAAKQMEISREAWAAFTAPDPSGLAALSQNKDLDSAMPFLRSALVRFLQEYPSAQNGLSRTQEQILRAVADGNRDWKQIYLKSREPEEAVFMGDSSFLLRVDELAGGAAAALQGDRKAGYSMTLLGEALLTSDADWIRSRGEIDCWLGGVHLQGEYSRWRWDKAQGELRT